MSLDRELAPELSGSSRSAMIALASRALGTMAAAHIPPALRKPASFAPAKRARLVGKHLVDAVAGNDSFREHLAKQVRALAPEVVAQLESTDSPPPSDLAEAAAVAFIVRPDGWESVVTAAAAAEQDRREGPAGNHTATVERLAEALAQARGDAKLAREKARTQVGELKAENAQLRRTLGQARAELRVAHNAATHERDGRDEAQKSAAVTARGAEAESRRLRARIAELEADTGSARRAARGSHGTEIMRLRLLLDTLTDAAAGLRRELALPPSDGLPADTVVAVEPASGSGALAAGRSLTDDDPALLRRLLELPRVHLIVDGYNVSKTAWPTLPLDLQRSRLISGLSALTGGKAVETTVVFDGADLDSPPSVSSPRGIRVRFSPPDVIADDLIRQLVDAEPLGRPVVVVSTDREVASSVTKNGARAVASLALVRALGV